MAVIAGMTKPDLTTYLVPQLEWINHYAELREDRAIEITAQLGYPIAFWSAIANIHPTRHRWTLELLDTAMRFANMVHMRFKAALKCVRPVELSAQVQPMILTPGHNSLPSGHATEAYMTAVILRELRGESPASGFDTQLQRQAARIAINRTIAGVHYPIDSVAGRILGTSLAEYFLARCDKTAQGSLEDAVSLLSGCPNISLILNAVHFSPSGRRFGSYYGYGG